uniref:RRM domain-containing protein n=1 Tax=Chelydra serpentina TaxID=8475 RepID=A0A8C3RK43_CHESE
IMPPSSPDTASPAKSPEWLPLLHMRRTRMTRADPVPNALFPLPDVSGTDVIQVTNVSPSASSEQMRTLFGFLGKIEELRLFPPDDSPLPVSSRVCFVKFHDPDSAVVAQHLTNTVFVDRALIVVPYAEGFLPQYSSVDFFSLFKSEWGSGLAVILQCPCYIV